MRRFFKKHIIKDGKYYYIRKFTFIGYVYLDSEDDYWWSGRKGWAQFKTFEEAAKRLSEYKNIKIFYV